MRRFIPLGNSMQGMASLNGKYNIPDNVKGILWALLSTAMYALVAAMAKVAVTEYHVLQILFFRQVIVFLSCVPSIARSFPGSLKTRYPVIHGWRLVGAFTALSFGIWAVSVLPLTTAITLGFAQVFFVALLAQAFLKETVTIHRLLAIITGFVGVAVVMRPGIEGIVDIYALIPLLGALGSGVAVISVRKLSQTESTATLLTYQALFVGILSGVPLLWLWKTPDLTALLFMLCMGIVATVGQWCGIKSLRTGEASIVSNVQYMQLIYAAILGFFLFGEVPDVYTTIGAITIIGSSVYMLRYETRQKKQNKG
jgi:drug/metabolite transporter (DMT)-like permease